MTWYAHLVLLAPSSDRPRDHCGVVGVYLRHEHPERDQAARRALYALYALQHRGQEGAGIASWDERSSRVRAHRDLGLVTEVFRDEAALAPLASNRSIGHVRYSTRGPSVPENVQPVVIEGVREVAVAHNGHLTNARQLREELVSAGIDLATSSDTELFAAIVAHHPGSVKEGISEAMRRCKGAYSLTILADGKVYGCRDAVGIRPLVLGLLTDDDGSEEGFVLASETCALDLLGARYLQDVGPGQLLTLNRHGMQIDQVHTPRPRPCSFEAIYFARPDSRLGSESVYDIRTRLGEQLSRVAPVDADLVIAVPDSGHCMAVGYARASGLPYGDGLIKNRYVGRTFIEPTPRERELALRRKFNALPSSIAGQRVVVVDDSLIRGATCRQIIGQLREAGASEVHVRIGAPPAMHPCHYGIDMGRPGEYIAVDARGRMRPLSDLADDIGADSLAYLTLDGLAQALKRPLNRRCTACFSGDYPVPVDDDGRDSTSTGLPDGYEESRRHE